MIEEPAEPHGGLTPLLGHDVATAPGHIPQAEIDARFEALCRQFRHDNRIHPLAPRPGEPVEIHATSGAEVDLVSAWVRYSTDGSPPEGGVSELPMAPDGVEWDPRGGFITRWKGIIPGQPEGTVVRYRLRGERAGAAGPAGEVWAHDGQGFWFKFPGEEGITTFAYRVEAAGAPLPAWMDDAVIYHIFLDRFHPGTPDGVFPPGAGPRDRHGGTLSGVRQALPYLSSLGVSCLWLSPLSRSETYHRYDTIDYTGVDPALGTEEDLQRLVDEAHALGMRLWLDFVPAHSSWRHPAFQAAQRDRAAESYSWYTFHDWPDAYRSFLQMSRYLPSLNADDPGARAHLLAAARYWLERFGVDGYRIDHTIAISMDFWVALRGATKAVKEDVVLVGEATDTPDALRRYRGKLHGILDFPLANALRLTFGLGRWDVVQLDGFLRAYEGYMEGGPGRVSFLDNHDMDRFLWVAGNDARRLKMAAICQFALSATPVVYYGTEIGLTQQHGASEQGFGGDAQARGEMPWDERAWDGELLAFYRALIALRAAYPALRSGRRRCLHLDGESNTCAYLQHEPGGTDSLVLAFNLSTERQRMTLSFPEAGEGVECLLSTEHVPVSVDSSHAVRLDLAPLTAAVLRL